MNQTDSYIISHCT